MVKIKLTRSHDVLEDFVDKIVSQNKPFFFEGRIRDDSLAKTSKEENLVRTVYHINRLGLS